jgi:cytochrome c
MFPMCKIDSYVVDHRVFSRSLSPSQFVLTCVTFLILSGSDASSQAVNGGQLLFNNACRTCHTVKEGDNRLGPNLYKIIGRKAGSLPNYGYSSAMRSADFYWGKDQLDRFLENPDAIVPGNNMKPYDGLAAAKRAEVISFLESLTTGQ